MIKTAFYNCSCGYNAADDFEGKFNRSCSSCGEYVRRYTIRYNSKQRRSNFANITYKENERYSVSLGVLDEDLPAARKAHPQAEWKKFGNSWRPRIRNRPEKLKLMKQAKMTEYQ